jgi:hypothetical protein
MAEQPKTIRGEEALLLVPPPRRVMATIGTFFVSWSFLDFAME